MSDGIIRSLGAGSGIDTTSLINGLVQVERAPQENRLNTRQEQLNAQISAYGTLNSSLSTFKTALSALGNNDTFNARSVAFPETNVITPNSVQPGAQTGTYQIEVLQVAQAQSLASRSFADRNAALNESGTLTISFGSFVYDEDPTNGNPAADADNINEPFSFTANANRAALNITVGSGDSLDDIAQKINGQNAGVQASVLAVDGRFQLLLTAPSGANNALRITSDDTTKGDTTGLSVFEFNETEFSGVTETQQGRDASIKVNGLAVTRDKNEINDVIDGFNFTLNRANPGNNLTFSVTADTNTAEKAIRDFVTAYNTFFQSTQNLTGTRRTEDNQTVRGDLATDGAARAIVSQVRSSISSLVPGVTGNFNALTNIGIRTERDGTLTINDTDLRNAISNNFSQVERLFATATSSSNNQVTIGQGSRANEARAGSFDVVVSRNPERATLTLGAIGGANVNFTDGPPDRVNFNAAAAGNDFSFILTVDGTESNRIALTGNYTTVEELRADLQSKINGDSKLKGANVAVDVAYNQTTNAFSLTSRSFGSSSNLSLQAANLGSSISQLGFAAASDAGVDAAGTIDGKEAFGSGNILLPKIGSDLSGLNFRIGENAVAAGKVKTNFSRGFAGELSNLIDTFISNNGLIDRREANINAQLEGVRSDRADLERRIELFRGRLTQQFIASERIIGAFQSTGNQLTGLVDRLPFTARRR